MGKNNRRDAEIRSKILDFVKENEPTDSKHLIEFGFESCPLCFRPHFNSQEILANLLRLFSEGLVDLTVERKIVIPQSP